jgi:nitrogen regulatory protein PII
MKLVVAVIKPFLAEKVIRAISEMNVDEISIREVKGFGRQKNYLDRYSENEYSLAFVPKIEISVWIADENLEQVIDEIEAIARTGRLGDGKIFVLPVEGGVQYAQDNIGARLGKQAI